MDIQDVYYNKYIKYKLKYLELKQSGGVYIPFYTSYIQEKKKEKEIEFYGEEEYKQIEDFILITDSQQGKLDNIETKKTKISNIESFLLNKLINKLKSKNEFKEDFENIKKEILNTILNYRQYFYLNKFSYNNLEKQSKNETETETEIKRNILSLRNSYYRKIRLANEKIIKYLDNLIKIFKFKKLKTLINQYFEYINILNTLDKPISLNFYDDDDYKEDISKKFNDEITELVTITRYLKKNYYEITTKLSYIQNLVKQYELYNNKNNIDDNIMLINCYFILINLMFVKFKDIELNYYDYNNILFGGSLSQDIGLNKYDYNNILLDGGTLSQDNIIVILHTLSSIIYYYKKNLTELNIIYNEKEYILPKDLDNLLKDIKIKIENNFQDNELINVLKFYLNHTILHINNF